MKQKILIKTFLNKHFSSFIYFYSHLGHRVFISLVLSLGVGILDGLGISMFLPLLTMVTGSSSTSSPDAMGGMKFIVEAFEELNVPIILENVLLLIVVFFSLKGFTFFIRQYYNVVIRTYFIKTLRFGNIDGLAHYKYKAFVQADMGRIQNTMSGEIERVSNALVFYLNTLQAIVMMFVYMMMALITNPQFAILVVIGGSFSNLAYRQIYKNTKLYSSKITLGGHRFQRQLIQFVGHFKYLKSTAMLEAYSRRLKQSVVFIEESNRKIGFYNSLLSATREPLNIIVVSVIILSQVYFCAEALSGIILALLLFYRALSYVMTFQTSWNNYLNVSGSLINMTNFTSELARNTEKYSYNIKSDFTGEIELKKVRFNYRDACVIDNVSLRIPPKKSVAIIGESGSGKTTLLNLITGLIRPDSGEILVDSLSYSELDIRSLQSSIGYISQDPVIFSESVYDNVTLWAELNETNIKRFWEACEKAAISDFIRGLPDGMNTELGNNGIQISGGQKQRLSIARELFKDVEILIMDEATSALDSNVEREVQKNIEALKGMFTIITVAHRLSTIQNVDIIYLMNNGVIEDRGSYNELLERSLRFKRMVKLQEL